MSEKKKTTAPKSAEEKEQKNRIPEHISGAEKLNELIFQQIPLALMVSFQKFQLRHLAVQIGHLNNARVAGSQGLDLGIA